VLLVHHIDVRATQRPGELLGNAYDGNDHHSPLPMVDKVDFAVG
jgi:hypothetical protein